MLQKYNIELKITPKFFIKSILKTIKFNLKNYLDMDNINAYNKAFKETFSSMIKF